MGETAVPSRGYFPLLRQPSKMIVRRDLLVQDLDRIDGLSNVHVGNGGLDTREAGSVPTAERDTP